MPRTVTKSVYQFDELSDKAKEKAREWYREASADDTWFAESVIDDAVRMGEMLGINFNTHQVTLMNNSTRSDPCIWWSLGYVQGDYAAFDGGYSYAPDAAKKISDETNGTEKELIRLADELERLQKLCGDTLTASIRYHHYYGLTVDVEAFADDDNPSDLPNKVEKDTREVFKDFCRWIYDGLRKENEYQNADEQIDETIRLNEYDFEIDGSRSRD